MTLAGPGETIASASAHEQLAAALASLANPGETIGSVAARDELTHGADASCEDLGECILKHFDKPIRAYRVGPASPHPNPPGRRNYGTAMEPTIAIISFNARNDVPEHFDIGNLIADSVIWRLSKAANMKVISRLSTTVFRRRASDVGEVSAYLGANYILSGAYVANAGKILITAELSAARNNQVVWTDRLSGEIGDLAANLSHALGWLYLGTVNAFKGEGRAAVLATQRAMQLSPLDPQRYYFESQAPRRSFRRINTRMLKSLRARRWRSICTPLPGGP